MKRLLTFFKKIYDFIFPPLPVCPVCNKPSQDASLCTVCTDELAALKPQNLPEGVISPTRYDGVAKQMIWGLKYHRKAYLADEIAALLAEAILNSGKKANAITYVPLHPAKKRRRGFDQAEMVALLVGETLGINVVPMLKRTRRTRAQAKLDPERRKQNVKNAFKCTETKDTNKKSVIIILDDVYTTGATMAACKGELIKAGYQTIHPATFSISTYNIK